MTNRVLSFIIPEAIYKKLVEKYEEEGYSSVHEFALDIIRDKLKVSEKSGNKRGRKKKRNFLDYFSKKRGV